MTDQRIEVRGLVAFQKELRAVDPAWPKALRVANKAVADRIAAGTRASFASRGGVAPKVAPSVRALAQQRNASVKIGGAKYPYAMGSEFGSMFYKQFPPWRGNQHTGGKPGYSLYETIRNTRDEVMEEYGDALDRLMRRAFPD